MTDRTDRDAVTPIHNTGVFSVWVDSSREWADRCLTISKDPTREMKAVRLPAATLAVKLRIAHETFREWVEEPSRRPGVVERQPIIGAYQDLAAETIRFLGGLGDAKRR